MANQRVKQDGLSQLVRGAEGPSSDQTDKIALLDDAGGGRHLVPPWRTSISLSLAFLCVYTGFEAIQNLQSSLNLDEDVGVISLAVTYAASVIGSISCPALARLLGPKVLLLVGFLSHLAYMACNLYPTLSALVPVSALLGVSMSGSSMAGALFITAASYSYLQYHQLDSGQLQRVLSMFNGFFYCFFRLTHLTGNLLASAILSTSSYNETVLENNVCGAAVCAGDTNRTLIESPDNESVGALLGVFVALNVIGCVVAIWGLPSLRVGADQTSYLKEEVTASSGCFSSLFSVKFLLLTPMFMSQAMIIMIMYNGYTKAFVTCTVGVHWVGYMMISLGVFSAAASLIVNNLVGLVGRVAVFCLVFVMDVSVLLTMLLWQPDSRTDKALLFILPAVVGVSISTSEPQANALIVTVFKQNLASAFSAQQANKCMAFVFILVLSTTCCLYHQLYLALSRCTV